MKKTGEKIEATFSNLLFYDNKIWFTEWNCNELYYYDLKKKQTIFFCKFNEEKEYALYLFGKILSYKNHLYLIPAFATNFYRVNIENREIKKIPIHFSGWQSVKNRAKFVSAHVLNGKIFMIGAACPLIVEYNCESEDIIYISKELNFIKEDKVFNTPIFVRKTLLVGKKIYIPLCQKNFVGIFDTSERKIAYKEVGSKQCGYSSICKDDNNFFWLAPRDKGPVVYWEENTGRWKEFDFPISYTPVESSFSDIIFWEGSIWIFPLNAKGIWKVDSNSKYLSLFNGIQKTSSRFHICCSYEKLFCFSEQENILYIIKNKYKRVELVHIFLPRERIEYHCNNKYEIKLNSDFYLNEQYYKNIWFIKEEKRTILLYYFLWIKKKESIKGIRKKQIGQFIYLQLIKQ